MTTTITLVAILTVFGAAIVRGFAGFGFSALCIAVLSFYIEPKAALPLILLLEVAASAWMIPSVWRDTAWRWLAFILLGIFAGTPVGMAGLTYLPADTMRSILYGGLIVLCGLAVGQQRGIVPRWQAPIVVVGLLAGLANGMAGVAGIVAALFMLSAEISEKKIRASMVMLFFFADIYAIAVSSGYGILTADQLRLFAIVLIPLFMGITIGSNIFSRYGAKNYRSIAIGLIFAASLLGIVRIFGG